MAKATQFDTIKTEATKSLYAVAGVADLAVEYARGYYAGVSKDLQKNVADVRTRASKVELEPKALRDQARTVISARVDELSKDAKKAQGRLEARYAELQDEAKSLPTKAQSFVNGGIKDAEEFYGDLAQRGEKLINRLRAQQATQDAKAAAKSTTTRAKTATTQTSNAAKSGASATKSSASRTTSTAKQSTAKTAKTAKTNAKSTSTSAKKTAAATKKAATDGASKVGN